MRTRRLAAGALWGILLGGLALTRPATSLEPVFSYENAGTAQDIKVCVLLLQSTAWENPEPFFLPTLATDQLQTIRNLRPGNWRLVNPLASTVVTPEIEKLWDRDYNGDVTFDGITAQVTNDLNSGDYAKNQADYNGSVDNRGGPNTYKSHCQPTHLTRYGKANPGSLRPLPPVGAPLTADHPAYWEVPLTPKTVTQLASFDAVFVNTHRNLSFTQQEQVLLKQFLDQGGTMFLEDSHGCRLEVVGGGDKTDPNDVDFFLKFQFVDGYPWAMGGANGGTRPDGYPVNAGGITTLTPSKTVVAAGHPLLSVLHTLSDAEADRLGDVRARDHLMIRQTPAIFLVEEILRTTSTHTQWARQTPVSEPAVAVARVGNGKLILSGIDMVDDCSKALEANPVREPTSDELPDIKFMFNLMAWKESAGGNRRGGAANPGIASGNAPRSATPRNVWHWPASRPDGASTTTEFNTVEARTTDINTGFTSDPNLMLREPLAAANGMVFLQYQDPSSGYYLVAVDARPEQDLDGDGSADDGPIRDMSDFGATTDTLWVRSLSAPVAGATVVTIQHATAGVPVDVLLITQPAVGGADTFRVTAIHATVDNAINTACGATPGQNFDNWTGGALDVTGVIGLDPTRLSGPVVYDDHVYVVASCNWNVPNAGPGEYLMVASLWLVDDPSSGATAGTLDWYYPNGAPEFPSAYVPGNTGYEALRQVDGNTAAQGAVNWLAVSPSAGVSQIQNQNVVPTLRDTTCHQPVIGLVKDNRTGLTAPWVYFNRANGDVWAVTGSAGAVGWRLDQEINLASWSVTIGGVDRSSWFQARPVLSADGLVVGTDLTVTPSALLTLRAAFQLPITAQLTYQPAVGPRVNEARVLHPLFRLLRGDRRSGYQAASGVAEVELLQTASGAPVLLGADRVAQAGSLLWRGAAEPLVGAAGQVRGSGTVTFFNAGGDGFPPIGADLNNLDAVQWVFDSLIALADPMGGTGQMLDATPSQTFSVFGSPVQYGETLLVAGAVRHSGATGFTRGAVMALNPRPLLHAELWSGGARFDLTRDMRSYLLAERLSVIQPLVGNLRLGSASSSADLAAFVVDPASYRLDPTADELHLRASTAHLTRLAHPTGPDAYRVPLYGRPLSLLIDVNGNEVYDPGVDLELPVYIPSPVRALYLADTVLLDTTERVELGSITVEEASTGANWSAGTEYTLDGYGRPLLRVAAAHRGKTIYVRYTTQSGRNVTEKHEVPDSLPAFCFSPVVAGEKVYVSGTQLGVLGDPAVPDTGAWARNGGLYGFQFGHDDHVWSVERLYPETLPTWENFDDAEPSLSLVRGIPLPVDDTVFVSFTLQGDSSGSAPHSGRVVSPLYAVGGSELLVTEPMRLARVDLDGRVRWQLGAVREKDGNQRPTEQLSNNPTAASIITSRLSKPTKAMNLETGNILLVDPGMDRVVEVDDSGMVVWPADSRTGMPDGTLRYLGLRQFGLNRPSDAWRFYLNQAVHPQSGIDVNNDGNVDLNDVVRKDLTVIADRGNRRIVMVVSYPRSVAGATQTYYEPLDWTATGQGDAWPLTAERVYDPKTRQWVELPYVQIQPWDPRANDQDPRHDPANAQRDWYLVARVAGQDRLFNLDPDSNNSGRLDDNPADGEVDGLARNLDEMVDQWSVDTSGQPMTFRGLRWFHRFRVGQTPYLAVIQANAADQGRPMVVVYERTATGLAQRWTFDRTAYRERVYDSTTDNNSFYERANIIYALRFDRWFAGGRKLWNPVSVTMLEHQNRLAIVNGASNAANQVGSNSELLLVRFDPSTTGDTTLERKIVDYVLPDLAQTTAYPAGQTTSRKRPVPDSYPISSPVYAHQ